MARNRTARSGWTLIGISKQLGWVGRAACWRRTGRHKTALQPDAAFCYSSVSFIHVRTAGISTRHNHAGLLRRSTKDVISMTDNIGLRPDAVAWRDRIE